MVSVPLSQNGPPMVAGDHRRLLGAFALTFCHGLAIASSAYRLKRRWQYQQLWRDDHLAFVAAVTDCVYFSTIWLRIVPFGQHETRLWLIDLRVTASWISQVAYLLVLWLTRISLALTVVRIAPPGTRVRRASVSLAMIFGVILFGQTVQTIDHCSRRNTRWRYEPPYQCPLSKTIGVSRLAADFLADLLLVLIPCIAFFQQTKKPSVGRRLIQACFIANIVPFVSVLVLFIISLSLSGNPDRSRLAAISSTLCHIIATLALMVCNALVVVTSVYRRFRTEPNVAPIGDPEGAQVPPNQPAPPVRIATRLPGTPTTDALRMSRHTFSESQWQPDSNNAPSTGHANFPFDSQMTSQTSGRNLTNASSSRIELTEIIETYFTLPITPLANIEPAHVPTTSSVVHGQGGPESVSQDDG